MAKITITRSREWSNRMRLIGIYIDDEQIGNLANGETRVFEVAGGLHRLKAKIDWCSSRDVPFTVGENDHKFFRLSGFKYSNIIMPIALLIVIAHFILSQFADIHYLIFLVVPCVLVTIYYITWGRNDYLSLRESDGS